MKNKKNPHINMDTPVCITKGYSAGPVSQPVSIELVTEPSRHKSTPQERVQSVINSSSCVFLSLSLHQLVLVFVVLITSDTMVTQFHHFKLLCLRFAYIFTAVQQTEFLTIGVSSTTLCKCHHTSIWLPLNWHTLCYKGQMKVRMCGCVLDQLCVWINCN